MRKIIFFKSVVAVQLICALFATQPTAAQTELKAEDYTVPSWTVLQSALKQMQKADMPYSISTVINGDPATRMGIAWFTNASVTDGMLQIVEKAKATSDDFANATTVKADAVTELSFNYMNASNNAAIIVKTGFTADCKRSYTSHKAVADGLKPGTTYSFRVGKDGAWSEIGSFTTATNDKSPFSFLYITDTQANTEEMFNVSQTTVHSAVKAFPDSKFVLCNGDFVESHGSKNSEWEWEQWFGTMQDVWLNYPLVAVQGNHDTSTNSNFFYHFNTDTTFNARADMVKTAMNGTVYSFVYNNALFLVVNYEDWNKEGYLDALAKWMEEQVNAHKEVKWRIATYHKTMFTGSQSHQSDQDQVKVREKMLPVFDKLKIDLALQGHDHIYEVIGPVKNADKTLENNEVEKVTIVGSGNARENMTGKEGGVFNVNEGTLYFLNNSAGKKKYEPRTEQQMIDAYKDHEVANYWGLFSGKFGQTGDPTFSAITVSADTISVKTYYVNSPGDNKPFDTFSVIKEKPSTGISAANKTGVDIRVNSNAKTIDITGCEPSKVYVISTAGSLVKKTSGKTIDISNLSAGVYLIRALAGNNEYSKKVIIY
jgi:hypothetical protein